MELVLEKAERLLALLFTIMSLEESEQFGSVFRQISDLMRNEILKMLLVLDIVQFIYWINLSTERSEIKIVRKE